jgi:long-chain fatty acid transport protein
MKDVLKLKVALILLFGLILLPRLAYGVGYEITDQDAKAMGLASAFVAQADNPSAIYFNPAGLTQIEKTTATTGLAVIDINARIVNNSNRERNKNGDYYIPNFFFSTPLGVSNLTFGLGMYSPYGLGTEWDSDSITKYSSIKAELTTIFVTPTLAWKPIPEISVGAGVSYIYSEAELTQKFPFSLVVPALSGGLLTSDDADVSLEGKAWDVGWTAGILAQPTDKLSLGFNYRSETILEYKASFEAENISAGAQTLAAMGGETVGSQFRSDAKLELPLPHRFSWGIAYKPLSNWTVEFDYERILWSTLKSLDVELDDENLYFNDEVGEKKRDWRDTNAFKLGTEVRIADVLALRTGGFYYQTPVPNNTLDPAIPDNDRFGFTVGLGYQIGSFNVDVGYMEVFSQVREVKNDSLEANNAIVKAAGLTPGRDRYENRCRLVGLNLTYNF